MFRNGYNLHRDKLRQSPDYRLEIVSNIFILKGVFYITEIVNEKISKFLNNSNLNMKQETD
jgi:hypothetical protein